MIKIIAADMDGTLLNTKHTMSERTYRTILKAQDAGYRFMIATGRDYPGALGALGGYPLTCDFITGSGAQIRNEKGELLFTITMDPDRFHEISDRAEKMGGAVRFCAIGTDYVIADPDTLEARLIAESKVFLGTGNEEEIRKMDLFRQMKKRVRCVNSIDEILQKEIPIYKIFITAPDGDAAAEMRKEFGKDPSLAAASSFYNNVELTDVRAQKGCAVRSYIQSLGFTADEVMVLGDSLNDLSMFTEGFGAAVAMANADPEIRKAADYITLSNYSDGASYAMELLMDGKLNQLKKTL